MFSLSRDQMEDSAVGFDMHDARIGNEKLYHRRALWIRNELEKLIIFAWAVEIDYVSCHVLAVQCSIPRYGGQGITARQLNQMRLRNLRK